MCEERRGCEVGGARNSKMREGKEREEEGGGGKGGRLLVPPNAGLITLKYLKDSRELRQSRRHLELEKYCGNKNKST